MFESIESTLYPIVCNINTYLCNYILVFLLLGVGLWYSIKTRFVQVRCFGEGMRTACSATCRCAARSMTAA